MARAIERHRAWAIRLFALAIASWLYRMEYGLYLGLMGGTGHTDDFRGWFDYIMAFAFYVPNLIVAELFIRHPVTTWPGPARGALAVVCLTVAGLVGIATWFFVDHVWLPKIVEHGPALWGGGMG